MLPQLTADMKERQRRILELQQRRWERQQHTVVVRDKVEELDMAGRLELLLVDLLALDMELDDRQELDGQLVQGRA